jgi:TonB-dependent receptor
MADGSGRALSRRARLLLLAGTSSSVLLAGAAAAQSATAEPSPRQVAQNQPAAPPADPAQPAVAGTQTPDQQTQAPPPGESIVITGYRGSLQSSTNAKKRSVGFVDTIYAEDIGKFPDTNIAESFNRIPGITIMREITGEGLEVSIRGLGPNFTRVTLNNAPILVASTGRDGSQNTNREVDLDLFPTELFTKLTVSKTPTPGMLEGGAAGNVDMRSARPFDSSGAHLTYSAQASKMTHSNKWGYRGSILASDTFGNFGVLVGAAGARNEVWTKGFETVGWTNPNLSAAQCGATSGCNSTGGGNWTIPATVPSNANIPGVAAGTIIDKNFLLAQNPGATIQQIDNGIIPRLGRPVDEYGRKDRWNLIGALEYKGDRLHLYLDSMYARKHNDMLRTDINWVGRNGAAIPVNTQYDKTDCSQGCTVTKGTYYNAQWFLEFRPWKENLHYWGVNPGLEYQFSDRLKLDLNGNYTKSRFHREVPSVLVITPANSGVTVNYDNSKGDFPSITTNVDLDNPVSFGWPGGRVNIQDEKRNTYTKGARGSLTWGDQHLNVHVGSAYDDQARWIHGYDASQQWQNAVCGDNPSVFLPSPNGQPPCQGLNTATPGAGYPTWPAFGTGYTAGQTGPIVYQGSLIPQSQLANFLGAGPAGYITVDWDQFRKASQYDKFHAAEPESGGTNTGASGGYFRERTWGAFAEANGDWLLGDNELLLNAGIRWVKTWQTIGGNVSIADPRNADPDGTGPTPACAAFTTRDGSCYPNITNFVTTKHDYTNWLPSASAAFHIGRNAIVRAAVSRTMTRPNPSAMLPGLNFSSPSADVGSVGNPALAPYISNNMDFGFEYYTGKEGYVGVAAFRKSVSGFTVNGNVTVPFSTLAQYGVTYDTLSPTQQTAINSRGGPSAANVVLTEQVNSPGKLKINGIELTWVQPLDFLLGRYLGLNGFGFNANMTIVDQSGSGSAQAVATGVPPRAYNVTGYYENHGLSLRLSRTWAKAFIASGFNQNGIPLAALYSDNYGQWDFAGSVDLAKIMNNDRLPQLTLDVQNITKEKQRSYFQFPNATFSLFDPGRLILVGLRGHF